MEALAWLLSLILQPCYAISGNWWIAILLFTIIVKIILIPMSLWCQKNSIVMVQLMPALNRLKMKYYGDRETIGEEQNKLYKEQHYHPMLSLIPLAVQIIILFGLVDVIHTITDGGAPGTEFLGQIPFEDGGAAWIMPLFAGLSAIIMGFAQNRINPLQREQSRAEKNMTNGLSIGLDAAVVVGNPEVITTALIMIPVTILIAFILPGNRMMPLADLAVVTFRVALVVALCRGNVFRSILISIPVMAAILYAGTFAAPYLTGLAQSTGLSFDGQIACMAGPSLTQTAIVFWSCISQNAVIVVPVVIVIFAAVWFLVEKKIGMEKIEAYAAEYDEM